VPKTGTSARRPSIYYELEGHGDRPPLLLIRGLGRTLVHWEAIISHLEPAFRLILFDNRGIGRSDAARMPYSTRDMADDAVRVLDHAGVERCHVFGMSLGGMVAQQMAIAHASRVDRLVLGCTTAGGRRAEHAKLRTWLSMARARVRGPEHAAEVESRLLFSRRFVRDHPEAVGRWAAIGRRYPVSAQTLVLQALAGLRHRTEAHLHRITAPTLIISSDDDAIIPPTNSRLLARRIKGAEIAWIPAAGHDFVTERPDDMARILATFLLG